MRIKLMLFLSFLFLTAIGNSIFTFKMEAYEEDKLKWVIHTHEVLIETEKLLTHLKDAETGQRGYLLTLNNSYLKPYHSGVSLTKVHFDKLRRLTSNNAEQQKRLDALQDHIALKLDELATTISFADTNRIDQALALVK